MRRVAIGPTDRLRCFVVAMDISTNLASQVGDGGEDAARQQVALDLRQPEFDLIQPGRIARVKCSRTFGCSSKKVRTACVLWVEKLSAIT